jgi:hypothetical protein
MAPNTWLMRCATELERLYMIGPRCGEDDRPSEGRGVVTAAELAGSDRYRGSPDFLVEVCMLIYSQRTD